MLNARQLDALEARRESDEALARALAYAQQKRAEERAKILAFVPKHVPADITRLQSIPYQDIADRRAEVEDITKPTKSKREGRRLEAFGQRKTLKVWCAERGLKEENIRQRLCRGWTLERALSTPVGPWGRGRVEGASKPQGPARDPSRKRSPN